MLKIRFMGAAGTVTGSKYSITYGAQKILIDCGLFQGPPELKARNWERLAEKPSSFDAMVLTHAHIDHSGYIPRLVRDGYAGKILCTHGTKDLCSLLLPDSARIQEEEANYRNRKQLTRHNPALPLYTEMEALAAVKRMVSYPYHKAFPVVRGVKVTFHDAGHILGSAWLEMEFDPLEGGSKKIRILFSGDLGRENAPILRDPELPIQPDFLVLESTYGDRLHTSTPVEEGLADIVMDTIRDRSVLIIPAFAVERAQELVYLLDQLQSNKLITPIPVFIDSPMATRATRMFNEYPEYYDEEALALFKKAGTLLKYPQLRLCETVAQSKAIAEAKPPFIVISASGMATGGRVVHHLRNYLPDPRHRVLLVGYQSKGTRGWWLKNGATEIRIFGETVPVRAQILSLDGFSGHADYAQINRWLRTLKHPPERTFLVHGESDSLEAQRERVSQWKGWNVHVPEHLEEVTLL